MNWFNQNWGYLVLIGCIAIVALLFLLAISIIARPRPPVRETTRTDIYHVVDEPNGVECWLRRNHAGLWCRSLPDRMERP